MLSLPFGFGDIGYPSVDERVHLRSAYPPSDSGLTPEFSTGVPNLKCQRLSGTADASGEGILEERSPLQATRERQGGAGRPRPAVNG